MGNEKSKKGQLNNDDDDDPEKRLLSFSRNNSQVWLSIILLEI
jgi:hypothetical protein